MTNSGETAAKRMQPSQSDVGVPARRFAGSRALLRGTAILALGLGLSACDYPDETTRALVYLPDGTQRVSARAEREAQLRTGTYRDDAPEFTGAPGPHGEHPAYVPSRGKTVFRDDFTTNNPDAQTATAAQVRAATTDTFDTTVSVIELEQASDGRSYVVLEEGR